MTKRLAIVALVLLALYGASWPLRHSQGQDAKTPAQVVYSQNGVHIVLSASGNKVAPMKMSKFAMSLSDVEGRPIPNASVTMNLQMPRMFCGVIPTTVQSTKPGAYEAAGIPVMRGRWEAEASISIGKEHFSVTLPFDVG
ncbi:hypothetical protein [Cohnella soli]|uniref:YtkA-like domain-containing protein n=1 Tax=Cohnella soli TaxID=425005 RepID=A0ABW0I0S3_9BACL